jgi:DNA-binding XRE family transcriptional regulator
MEKLAHWAKELEQRRNKLELTQFDLAEMTGLSDLTIRNIEKGKPTVAIGNWLKVCEALGFTMDISIKRMSDEARKSLQQ